jgi:hypothetical protein
MLTLVFFFLDAPEVRARDCGDRDSSRRNDDRGRLLLRRVFPRGRRGAAQTLLDQPPDELAHRRTAQSRSSLQSAVQVVWKIDGRSHIHIFAL